MQGDVMVDASCEPFMEAVLNEFPDSKASRAIVAHLVSMFDSRERSLRTAALLKLNLLLPALRRDPSSCPASVASIVDHTRDCFRDTDRQLNLAAVRAVVVLCQFWCNVRDDASLDRINTEFLPLLRNLANADPDPQMRAEVCEAVASLVASFERISGLVAIKIVVGCLLDVDDGVKLAALRSVQQLQPLLPCVLVVTHVMPSLVRLLLSRNNAVRQASAKLVQSFAEIAARASDMSTWPEVPPGVQWPAQEGAALPHAKSAIFVGSSVAQSGGMTRAAPAASGAPHAAPLAIGRASAGQSNKAVVANDIINHNDDDGDDDDDGEWGATNWADKQAPVAEDIAPEGGFFEGLTLVTDVADTAISVVPSQAHEVVLPTATEELPPLRPRGRSFASGPIVPARGSPPLVAGLEDLLGSRSSDAQAAATAADEQQAAGAAGWFRPIVASDDDDEGEEESEDEDTGPRFDDSAWKSVKKDEIFSVNVVPVHAATVRTSERTSAASVVAPRLEPVAVPVEAAAAGRLSLADVAEAAQPLALDLNLSAADRDDAAGEGWGSDDLSLALDVSSAQPSIAPPPPVAVAEAAGKDGWGDFDSDFDEEH